MSDSSLNALNARRSQARPIQPATSSDFSQCAALAETLQQTARALLDFAAEKEPEPAKCAAPEAAPANSRGPAKEVPHELCCYRVPSYMLKYEEGVLDAHRAKDLSGLLGKVYDNLYVTAYLMEHFGEAEDLDGFTIHLIGSSLQSSLHVLSKVCSVPALAPGGDRGYCKSSPGACRVRRTFAICGGAHGLASFAFHCG